MKQLSEIQPATPESVWAILQRTSEMIDKNAQEAEKRMKKIEETMGSWSNNHGCFAEEYFFNSFENGQQNFFGEQCDEIEKNVKGINFPEFKNHPVYLGLATMAFYPELEQECIDHGIAVIKQMGDTVVINDQNLKVY